MKNLLTATFLIIFFSISKAMEESSSASQTNSDFKTTEEREELKRKIAYSRKQEFSKDWATFVESFNTGQEIADSLREYVVINRERGWIVTSYEAAITALQDDNYYELAKILEEHRSSKSFNKVSYQFVADATGPMPLYTLLRLKKYYSGEWKGKAVILFKAGKNSHELQCPFSSSGLIDEIVNLPKHYSPEEISLHF